MRVLLLPEEAELVELQLGRTQPEQAQHPR